MDKCLYKTIFFFASLLSLSPIAAADRSVEVLSSTDSEFRFRVSIRPSDLHWFRDADSSLVYVKPVKVGIPYGARVELGDVTGLSFAPLGADVIDSGKISTTRPLARVSDPMELRGRQMATVEIYPVLADGYFEQVDIRLRFAGGMRSSGRQVSDPQFDRILESVVANYAEFRKWPVPARSLSKLPSAVSPFSVTTDWYKIGVDKSGLFKVTASELVTAGLTLNNTSSSDIHVFGGGGLPLPADNSSARPELQEVSIIVEDGDDGIFNPGDDILFYGEAVDRLLREPADTFVNNGYTDRNIYWLAISPDFGQAGLRMTSQAVTPDGVYDTLITSFRRFAHSEQDNLLCRYQSTRIEDYYTWYWVSDSALSFFVSTPGAIPGRSALIGLNGRTSDPTGSSDLLGYINLTVNGVDGADKSCDDRHCSYTTSALVGGLNEIELQLWGSSTFDPFFDNIDIAYDSYCRPVNGRLELTLGPIPGEGRVVVFNEFNGAPVILDVTDRVHPVRLTGYEGGSQVTFETQLNGGSSNTLFFSAPSAVYTPLFIQAAEPLDLRADLGQTDLIVVTPSRFVSALDEYREYRQAQGRSVRLVTVEDIMDNFSWGLYDPIAVRDYLKFAFENYSEPAPSIVLFVGDGTYDFLDHLKTGQPNFVPPFINPVDESFTSSDDNYVYFGRYGILDGDSSYVMLDRGYDMMTARWPVSTTREIATITAKTRRYEATADLGAWRTNVTLVADDEVAGKGYAERSERIHVDDTEELERYHIPPGFNREKIYLFDYVRVNGYKPDVNDAVVDAINKGTLLVNYVGHGNPDLWAHEHVFTRLGDVPRLDNFDRLPLVYSASCEIAFFDDPKREGIGEDLLSAANGGAIASIAATRQVFASSNHSLNVDVFDRLLYNDSLTICEAMYAAKLARQYGGGSSPAPNRNDRAYLYFGDPLLKIGLPKHDMRFDDKPTSLTALRPATVSGQIIDGQGTPVGVSGSLTAYVFDSDRQKVYRILGSQGEILDSVSYALTGPAIFRGAANVTDGHFSFRFIPPLDIGYGGKGAKVLLYAQLDGADGAGIIDSIEIADSVATCTDSIGPTIAYAFPDRQGFASGDQVSSADRLEITLSDSSGINLAGGVGHGISLEVDGHSDRAVNLTSLFEYYPNDYMTGRLTYSPTGLTAGRHSFRIKAWDNANNPSEVEFSAVVGESEKAAIVDLLNYPNPMSDQTRFSYRLTQQVNSFSLEIFTLSGKKIRSFDRHALVPDFYDDIIWYGEDADGDRVATGVYIFKATAVPRAGGETVEAFGKVVVIN